MASAPMKGRAWHIDCPSNELPVLRTPSGASHGDAARPYFGVIGYSFGRTPKYTLSVGSTFSSHPLYPRLIIDGKKLGDSKSGRFTRTTLDAALSFIEKVVYGYAKFCSKQDDAVAYAYAKGFQGVFVNDEWRSGFNFSTMCLEEGFVQRTDCTPVAGFDDTIERIADREMTAIEKLKKELCDEKEAKVLLETQLDEALATIKELKLRPEEDYPIGAKVVLTRSKPGLSAHAGEVGEVVFGTRVEFGQILSAFRKGSAHLRLASSEEIEAAEKGAKAEKEAKAEGRKGGSRKGESRKGGGKKARSACFKENDKRCKNQTGTIT